MGKIEQLEKLLRQKKGKEFYSSRLNISVNEVEELLRELRKNKIDNNYYSQDVNYTPPESYLSTYTNNVEKGTVTYTSETDGARTLEELLRDHKVDTKLYKVSNYWSKQKGTKFFHSLFLTLIKHDEDLAAQRDILLQEIKDEAIYMPYKSSVRDGKYSYEINIPDVHFGKMSWAPESGEDYDLSIAEKRYEEAISSLLSLVDVKQIEEIIFPIGNDMINIDSRRNETFAGTGQDSDSRFFKIVKVVKAILIRNINSLSLIAPVRVVVISGNHDPETMFMLGEILDAYYWNNENVSIDNSPKQRKYYQYGLNGFQYSHGNEENHRDLGLIFATEESKLWADTKYRFCKLGHFHKNKTTSYLSIDEHQGFQVQVLPSLSGSDAWHKSKGYMSMKQAKGFLYHKEKGQVAEYNFNI